MAQEAPSSPGWYPHPQMVNTLCFWDGTAWTDKVQPMGDADAINDARKKLVGSLIALAIIFVLVIAIIASI